MREFWAYLQEYIEQLPLTDEDHEKATSFGWGGFSRCASSDSDSDVANLDDLEAFDLHDESSPCLSFE